MDVRFVCPQDVKKMFLKQANTTYWKKWAAKHEDDELKEGVWFDPIKAMLRRKTNAEWTDKHRNVMKHRLYLCAGMKSEVRSQRN